jgi:large subunit ribosomal protein L28
MKFLCYIIELGLYHGKDIHNGNRISHSHSRAKRFFYPNVQKKRVWSDAMNDWIRFNMTTAAMKAIDNFGGIDNYILSLDDRQIYDSKFVKKQRDLIASTMFYNGTLDIGIQKRLGFLKVPPKTILELQADEAAANLKSSQKGFRADKKKQIKPIELTDMVADL